MAPVKRNTSVIKRSTTIKKATKSGAITKKTKGGGRTDGTASSGQGIIVTTTREASCCAARDAVLLTTEVLEDILKHLSPRRLLIEQRVCRKFRAVISDSKLLQQKLFLAPAEAASGWLYEAPSNRREHGSLIQSPGRWTKISKDTLKHHQQLGQTAFAVGQANHVLFEQLQWADLEPDREPDAVWGSVTLIKRDPPSMRHQEASWRQMYMTQPPAECIEFFYNGKEQSKIRREGGVKVTDVIESGVALGLERGKPIRWKHFDIDVIDMIIGERVTGYRDY